MTSNLIALYVFFFGCLIFCEGAHRSIEFDATDAESFLILAYLIAMPVSIVGMAACLYSFILQGI